MNYPIHGVNVFAKHPVGQTLKNVLYLLNRYLVPPGLPQSGVRTPVLAPSGGAREDVVHEWDSS